MMPAPSGPPAAAPVRPDRGRLPGFDVVRAVALVGVVVMNFHGYLNGGAPPGASFGERVFDPFIGVLSTRFAATFVTVAGVGVVLLTNRSRLSGDPEARRRDRWRLVRRGLFLLVVGYVLDWIWAGTILFFYGAYFMAAALLFTLRIRWLALLAAVSALAAGAVQWWALDRTLAGADTSWLLRSGRASGDAASMRSPRAAVFDVLLHGTHPLVPWLTFFCVGMILGRLIPHLPRFRRPLILAGLGMMVVGYALATLIRRTYEFPTTDLEEHLLALSRTDPFSRQPLYVVTTLGSSIVATLGIAWLADRFPTSAPVDVLRRSGRLTLSIYLAHVLVFRTFVDQLRWVTPTGLDTALVFALVFWGLATMAGAWWQRMFGMGPAERVYREFGA